MKMEKFNSWLAGLIEGDGCIVTPEVRRGADGKKRYPHIQIAFNQKDRELAKYIITKVGGGLCNIDGNTVRLTWWKEAEQLDIIERINGKMRTPKKLRLDKLIDWYVEGGKKIEKQKIDETPIEENAWLSGMSDADANFNINLTAKKSGYGIKRQWRLEISQLTHHGGDQERWALEVSKWLGTTLYSRVRELELKGRPKKEYASYMIIAHSRDSHNKIEAYLEKYPLKSSKNLDYKDWKRIGELEAKTPENYKKIQQIKNGMNSKRIYFNWDHLNE